MTLMMAAFYLVVSVPRPSLSELAGVDGGDRRCVLREEAQTRISLEAISVYSLITRG